MSRLLYRLGSSAAAHPWRTVAAWIVVLVALVGLSSSFGGKLSDDYDIPGTRSQAATELLRAHFPGMAEADARAVVHSPSGTVSDADLTVLHDRLAAMPHVAGVSPAQRTADGDTALVVVRYDVPVTSFTGTEGVKALEKAGSPLAADGLQVEYGGQVVENAGGASSGSEGIGVLVALVVLLVAFGSFAAAGLPIAVALIGLGAGMSVVTLLAAVTDVSTAAPMVGAMVGIGVGIDYALLLVTRTVEFLREGPERRDAVAAATATAGSSVLFAGGTVLISLLGLRFTGLPVFRSFGLATGVVLVFVVATALTLVPALASLAGPRLLGRRERRGLAPRRRPHPGGPLTARWARKVAARPLPWALAGLVLMLALAAPALAMRTWPQDAGDAPLSDTQRRAYDLVAVEYGPGANGPLTVAVDLTRVPSSSLDLLGTKIAGTPGVASVSKAVTSLDGDAAVYTVTPQWGPQDQRVTDLVHSLRADVLPGGADITGWTATFVDISGMLGQRLWLVIGFVVAVSLLLLVLVFRSVVVPVKAAAMNLLSAGAAYGVLVMVFQWGWGSSLFGMTHAVPVSTWVPILLFAVLFGLSMDYEVFLLGRVREEWLASGDARESVVRGLSATGRVITSGALIMVAVFTGFALAPDVTVKMIGVGLAAAIAVDATVVRMILAPATMALLGRANWWLPSWLDRALPTLDVEPPHPAAPTPTPEPQLVH